MLSAILDCCIIIAFLKVVASWFRNSEMNIIYYHLYAEALTFWKILAVLTCSLVLLRGFYLVHL